MKIDVVKINDMRLVPTSKQVVIGYDLYWEAPDEPVYEEIYADEYIDVCSGANFGRVVDEILTDVTGETMYQFVAVIKGESRKFRHATKKQRRKERLDKMVGTYFNPNTGIKKYGKTRFLRRRMHPNKAQRFSFCEDLPF